MLGYTWESRSLWPLSTVYQLGGVVNVTSFSQLTGKSYTSQRQFRDDSSFKRFKMSSARNISQRSGLWHSMTVSTSYPISWPVCLRLFSKTLSSFPEVLSSFPEDKQRDVTKTISLWVVIWKRVILLVDFRILYTLEFCTQTH